MSSFGGVERGREVFTLEEPLALALTELSASTSQDRAERMRTDEALAKEQLKEVSALNTLISETENGDSKRFEIWKMILFILLKRCSKESHEIQKKSFRLAIDNLFKHNLKLDKLAFNTLMQHFSNLSKTAEKISSLFDLKGFAYAALFSMLVLVWIIDLSRR